MTISTAPGETGRLVRWTHRELDALAVSRPRVEALLRQVWQRPGAVTLSLAAVTAAGFAAVVPGGDAGLFREAGTGMMGHGFLQVFSDGTLQIGPLYLATVGALAWVLNLGGSPLLTRTALAAAQAALLLWCALALVRRCARREGLPGVGPQWAVGLMLAIGGFVAEAIGNGHPEEILVGLLLAHAALWVTEGRPALAGLALGLGGGLKQWAAFGGGVVLLRRRWRDVLVAAGVALLVVAALYGPFLLWGTVHTYDFRWGIDQRSLLGRVGASWGLSDWGLRILQGGLAGLAGCVAAWRRPRSPLTPVAVAVAVRLLLDPLRLTYYSGPLVAVLATWAWTSRHPVVVRWRASLTLLSPIMVLAPYLLPPDATWAAGSVLLVAALASLSGADYPRRARRSLLRPPVGADS